MVIHSLADRSNDREGQNTSTWVSGMTENILNFYRGFWVSPCLPQLLFRCYIFSCFSFFFFFYGDADMNKEIRTVDKTLKMVWVQNIPSEMTTYFENGLFFLHMTSESFLLQHTWADFMHDLKYIKKAVTVLFSCFLVVLQQVVKTSHAPILFTGVHRIIVKALLLLQGQCFPESWIQSRTSLGKNVSYQNPWICKLSQQRSATSSSILAVFSMSHVFLCLERGWKLNCLKRSSEENWLFLTSEHSSSTRRENFKFWNLLFSY